MVRSGDSPWRKLSRSLVASIPFALGAAMLLQQAGNEQYSPARQAIAALLGIVLMAVTAFLISRPLAYLIADAFTQLIYPEVSDSKPPPLHKLCDWLIKKGRYEDAIREYERIIHFHPEDAEAHMGLLHIHRVLQPDAEAERKALRRALRMIRDTKIKAQLQKNHAPIP